MSKKANATKKRMCKEHRLMVYQQAIDAVLEGKKPPEYMHERYLKLKQVR